MNELNLDGIIDLHVHTDPDVKERCVNDLSMARRCLDAGMRGFLIKSHDWSTHDRAAIARQAIPDCEIFGGICLNLSHGKFISSFPVKQALRTWGNLCKCVWLPTRESMYDMARWGNREYGVAITDDSGALLPEVTRIMELCAESDIMLASGHSSPEEILQLAKAARSIGLKKFVITHATSDPWLVPPDILEKCVNLGAFVEHSCIALLWGEGTPFPNFKKCPEKLFFDYLRLAPEQSFISSDLGIKDMDYPDVALASIMKRLHEAGFGAHQIDMWTKTNPAKLLNLP